MLTATHPNPPIPAISLQALVSNTLRFLYWSVLVALAGSILFLLVIRSEQPGCASGQHYRYLAHALLHCRFAVDDLPPYTGDVVKAGGHTYVPMGPMPAIVLSPIIAVLRLFRLHFDGFEEPLACLGITFLSGLALNQLLQHLGISEILRRRWLLALFFFGTVYFWLLVVGVSWHTASLLTVGFLLAAVSEELGRKRYWLIGILMGAAFLSRVTAIFGMPFFLYLMWHERRLNARNILQLAAGLVPFFAFWAFYNYARFGNMLETGYSYATLLGPGDILDRARAYGLFSPLHIPKNLYMLLLATPQPVGGFAAPVLKFPYIQPSSWGMSIFLTTPAFVYAFRANWRDPRVFAAWLAVGSILIPLLTYYGIGWSQFGYRYALDFYPFLIIPTALAINRRAGKRNRSLTRGQRTLIILCVLVNLWGAWVMYSGKIIL